MIKKVLILILPFIISGIISYSQELSHKVLVPAAGDVSISGINYSQTIGETAVEIFVSSDYILTQGFQQPRIKFIPVSIPQGQGVITYPNPVVDIVNIVLFGETAQSFKISIVNITGTVIYSYEKSFTDQFYDIQEVSLDSFARGFYFIRVISKDGIINRVFKIEKM